jgi:hypothetical protein
MPGGVEGDDDLQRGLERLARYADDPILADLVARCTPPGLRQPARAVDLANLRELIDETFGPGHLPAPSALERVWARAPSSPDPFATYVGAVVRGVRAGSSVDQAAVGWLVGHHHARLKRRQPLPDEWAAQFTRGPAWPP